jgi:nicotinamide phosphoribosyltransferase
MLNNIILLSDSYKASHYKQYPPGTTKVYSYFESRGGDFPETVFFGLQYILKEYLVGQVVTPGAIAQAAGMLAEHFSSDQLFNHEGWDHIRRDHDGHLPVSIRAALEGTVVPTHNVLMTVENTCPKCYWVTNYLETLLVQTWYPTTVATQSRAIKEVIAKYLESTGDPAGIDFKLHDFGFRGVSSVESAAIGGASHLVNFRGTDTMVALKMLRDYYDARPVPGFSIPAAEHSTITSWGRENEVDAFRNMLDQYPTGLVAVVSDSFDIIRACYDLWGSELKDRVMSRNGVLVVRPDSGDPVPTVLAVIEALGTRFGCSVNAKGFKVLDPHVRVIQGDGVNFDSISEILHNLEQHKWSADNIAFGMGGALLQKLDRDTQKFAFKCSYIEGEATPSYGHLSNLNATVSKRWQRDVYKDPIGDYGKKSKRGRLALLNVNGEFTTNSSNGICGSSADNLREVFRDGRLLIDHDFSEVRKRAEV